MGKHEKYGKQVLRAAAGTFYTDTGPSIEVNYGAGQPARIDGTVAGKIAVEIESRVSKQVRGALLDLICHKYSKKLLVLLPVHMSAPGITAAQCKNIAERFLNPADFRIAILKGSGDIHYIETDASIVREALSALGFDR